jgi:hypothetical protein
VVFRTCLGLFVSLVFAWTGCDPVTEGDVSKGLYDSEFRVQDPDEERNVPKFGETVPPTEQGVAGESGQTEKQTAPTTDDGDQNPNSNTTPDEASNNEPSENKYCGDGVCGEGEDESCWIDCSPPPQNSSVDNSDNGSTDDDAPESTPASGPEANSEPPANDGSGPWSCVQAQCAFEWDMCMSDPTCAALHQCMLSCPGNEACKDQCLSNAGSLASLKLDDVAFCAAIMGCI